MNGESKPLWTSVNYVPRQFPWLDHELDCSTCVIGGGLTGALCALRLAQEGDDVVLLTSGQIGFSLTSDASPCVSFDFGHRVTDLKRKIGTENTIKLLEIGAEAIDMLEALTLEPGADFGFRRCDSLLYTNDERELELFNREYLIRKHNGFDCSFMNRSAARDIFSFPVAGGIFSKGLAATFDPYLLTQFCINRAVELGARVFENTKVEQLDSKGKCVVIDTATRQRVYADKCVIAVGNAFDDILNIPTRIITGFYAVSEPAETFVGWTGKCVVRTWAQPDITLSPTPDGRVCCSGLNTFALNENGRLYGIINLPALSAKRFDELESAARCHFPAMDIDNFEFRRSIRWAVPQDSLPIIGVDGDHDKCFFACCPGQDGALYSIIAADMMSRALSGHYSEGDAMFSPMRFSQKQIRRKRA